jgi:hypothetical protein
MPHFGLMDETQMGREEAALTRAKLHIRGGRRRLRQGKQAAGIAALFDALISAVKWYVLSNRESMAAHIDNDEDLEDDEKLLELLVRPGIVQLSFDLDRFRSRLNSALEDRLTDAVAKELSAQMEEIMTGLGVLPFDENTLPPEDPSTF